MPQKKHSALERARADLQSGRPDIARDRVTGYLSNLHQRGAYSQEAYLLLGEIYFAMKDFPLAGAAWFMTERDDADSRMANNAFEQRYGLDPTQILQTVKPRAPLEAYPLMVRQRLEGCGYVGVSQFGRKNEALESEKQASGVRPIEAGCLLFAILCVIFVVYYFYLLSRGHG